MIYSEFIPALTKEIKDITTLGEYMPKHFVIKAKHISEAIDRISDVTEELKAKFETVSHIKDVKEKAMAIVHEIMPLVDKARFECDTIERHLSVKNHPYPSYEKLFFALDF